MVIFVDDVTDSSAFDCMVCATPKNQQTDGLDSIYVYLLLDKYFVEHCPSHNRSPRARDETTHTQTHKQTI